MMKTNLRGFLPSSSSTTTTQSRLITTSNRSTVQSKPTSTAKLSKSINNIQRSVPILKKRTIMSNSNKNNKTILLERLNSLNRTLSFDSNNKNKMNNYSTTTTATKASEDQSSVILTKTDGYSRVLTLNRPSSLNAVNIEMVELMTSNLLKWERSEDAKLIILKANGRAFCAGGDVVSVIDAINEKAGKGSRNDALRFFNSEYVLDSFIAKMSTPIVSFLDGITMGGGLGIAMHTPFRVATEKTRVAMPETTIGLFPDVGATFFLPRLDGEIGTYLGLTSKNLIGWNAYQAGFATHFVSSEQLPLLEERLMSLGSNVTHDQVDSILNEFSTDPFQSSTAKNEENELVGIKRQMIDYCFKEESIEKIFENLRKVERGEIFSKNEKESSDGSGISDDEIKGWAKGLIENLGMKSPTSLKLTLLALREGKKLNIDECFLMEMRLATTCCKFEIHPDFVTGVNHLLIKKDKSRPEWNPSRIESIELKDLKQKFFSSKAIENLFTREEEELMKLKFIETKIKPYKDYPHKSSWSLPSERLIKDLVVGNLRGFSGDFGITESDLIKFFKDYPMNLNFGSKIKGKGSYGSGGGDGGGVVGSCWFDKVGVQEKIYEVLRRKTNFKFMKDGVDSDGFVLEWDY